MNNLKTDKQLDENNSNLDKQNLIKASIAILVLWFGSGVALYWYDERGTFGDMFGAINALFSGFAFLGLIYAILLQKTELRLQRKELANTREEISLQRDEMKLTRGELKGQKESMELQNEYLKIQNFEGTFFQMLRLHNDLLNSMDIQRSGGKPAHTGRDCFNFFVQAYRNHKVAIGTPSEKRKVKYDNLWSHYQTDLGSYFRSLYNIFKMIDESNLEDKKRYSNIVRAQLSEQELIIIFINVLYSGEAKFKILINKFCLLKHLPVKNNVLQEELEHYDKSAYGGKYPEIV